MADEIEILDLGEFPIDGQLCAVFVSVDRKALKATVQNKHLGWKKTQRLKDGKAIRSTWLSGAMHVSIVPSNSPLMRIRKGAAHA